MSFKRNTVYLIKYFHTYYKGEVWWLIRISYLCEIINILQTPISIIITLWFLIVLNPTMNSNCKVKGVTYPPPTHEISPFLYFSKELFNFLIFNYYYFLIEQFKYYTLHIKIYFLKLFNFYAYLVHCFSLICFSR